MTTDNHMADAILYAFHGHRARQDEAAASWHRQMRSVSSKRTIVIDIPEWMARARRAPNQVKAAVIGFTLIGFAIGGFAAIALIA